MEIIVDGKKLEHNVGDRYWYISFGNDGWTPTIRESGDSIERIEITEDGIAYFAGDNFEMSDTAMKEDGLFWTKEEAEKWFAENIPEALAFQPEEEFFYVLKTKWSQKPAVLIVRMAKLNCLIIRDGRLMYEAQQVTDGYGDRYFFTADDLGTTLFRTYEEAKQKKESMK